KEKRKEAREDMYIRKGKPTNRGRNIDNKTPVFAMVERGGKVIAYAAPRLTKQTIFTVAAHHIDKAAIVSTDESRLYDGLKQQLGLEHGRVSHMNDQYRNGQFCTNSVEGYFSQLKRTIRGTHISVSPAYLQNYINECSFRYNHRSEPNEMFNRIVEQFKP